MGASNQRQSQIDEATVPSCSDGRSILFEAITRNQCQSDEAILLSRTGDRSLSFKASNECMTSILGMKNIRQLDIAVTNTSARVVWLCSLQVTSCLPINEYKHCNGSIRWIVTRGITLDTLKVRDSRQFTQRINGSTLVGLNLSLLRDVSFRESDIGDEEVISLGHDCPYLSKICLYDCVRVTDASIMALARCCKSSIDMACPTLNFIFHVFLMY